MKKILLALLLLNIIQIPIVLSDYVQDEICFDYSTGNTLRCGICREGDFTDYSFPGVAYNRHQWTYPPGAAEQWTDNTDNEVSRCMDNHTLIKYSCHPNPANYYEFVEGISTEVSCDCEEFPTDMPGSGGMIGVCKNLQTLEGECNTDADCGTTPFCFYQSHYGLVYRAYYLLPHCVNPGTAESYCADESYYGEGQTGTEVKRNAEDRQLEGNTRVGTDADHDNWVLECGDCDDNDNTIRPSPSNEYCDGKDNDCEGGYPLDQYEIDTDGDGYFMCNGDEWEGNPDVYPGAPEICDSIDNDQDDDIDEGLEHPSQNQQGMCQDNQDICIEGEWTTTPYTPSTESCQTLGDDDCDGSINEGCDNNGGTDPGDIGVPEYSNFTVGLAIIMVGLGLVKLRKEK